MTKSKGIPEGTLEDITGFHRIVTRKLKHRGYNVTVYDSGNKTDLQDIEAPPISSLKNIITKYKTKYFRQAKEFHDYMIEYFKSRGQ